MVKDKQIDPINEAEVERLYLVLAEAAKSNSDSLFDLEVATPFFLRAMAREALRFVANRDRCQEKSCDAA